MTQVLASTLRYLPKRVRLDLFDVPKGEEGGPSAGLYIIQPGYDMLAAGYGSPADAAVKEDDENDASTRRYAGITTKELEKALFAELEYGDYKTKIVKPSTGKQDTLTSLWEKHNVVVYQGFKGTSKETTLDVKLEPPEVDGTRSGNTLCICEKEYDYLIAASGHNSDDQEKDDSIVRMILGEVSCDPRNVRVRKGRELAINWGGDKGTKDTIPRLWKQDREKGKKWEYYEEHETTLYGAIIVWKPSDEKRFKMIREDQSPSHKDQITKKNAVKFESLGPNAAYRAFRSRREKFYLGVTLTEKEYQNLQRDFQNTPEFKAGWKGVEGLKKLTKKPSGKQFVGLVNDGMKVFAMSGPEDKEKAGSLDMRVLKSNVSRAIHPIKIVRGKVVAAVGDAGFNVHYFTASGINAGCAMADFLTTLIAYKREKWPTKGGEKVCSVHREQVATVYQCSNFTAKHDDKTQNTYGLAKYLAKNDPKWTREEAMRVMYTDFMTYLQRGLHTENGSLNLSDQNKLEKSRNEMIGRIAPGNYNHNRFKRHLKRFDLSIDHLDQCGLCEVFAQNNRDTVHSDEWREITSDCAW
eukprot:g5943.t1